MERADPVRWAGTRCGYLLPARIGWIAKAIGAVPHGASTQPSSHPGPRRVSASVSNSTVPGPNKGKNTPAPTPASGRPNCSWASTAAAWGAGPLLARQRFERLAAG